MRAYWPKEATLPNVDEAVRVRQGAGLAEGMEGRGQMQIVKAIVPLAEVFGYATDLRSLTQGRASYSMEFHRYQEVPTNIATEIIAKAAGGR